MGSSPEVPTVANPTAGSISSPAQCFKDLAFRQLWRHRSRVAGFPVSAFLPHPSSLRSSLPSDRKVPRPLSAAHPPSPFLRRTDQGRKRRGRWREAAECQSWGPISFFFWLFRASPAAYGSSQARGLIGAVAASHSHSHSNARSELHLRPAPELIAKPDP